MSRRASRLTAQQTQNLQRNVPELLKLAVARIPEAEFRNRLGYCLVIGDFGVHVTVDEQAGRFVVRWAGDTLAAGPLELLWTDDLDAEVLLVVPSTVDELFGAER